jgi:DNA repair protein RadC
VEKFGIIALNVKQEINGIHIIGSGIVNRALVEPREVFMVKRQLFGRYSLVWNRKV